MTEDESHQVNESLTLRQLQRLVQSGDRHVQCRVANTTVDEYVDAELIEIEWTSQIARIRLKESSQICPSAQTGRLFLARPYQLRLPPEK